MLQTRFIGGAICAIQQCEVGAEVLDPPWPPDGSPCQFLIFSSDLGNMGVSQQTRAKQNNGDREEKHLIYELIGS
jgi:hypothetical protein